MDTERKNKLAAILAFGLQKILQLLAILAETDVFCVVFFLVLVKLERL
jgi:hypothetical protein